VAERDLLDPLDALLFLRDGTIPKKMKMTRILVLMILSKNQPMILMMRMMMRKRKSTEVVAADLPVEKLKDHLVQLQGKELLLHVVGMRKTTMMIMIDLGGHQEVEVDLGGAPRLQGVVILVEAADP
jgi:hypothetical protein